MSTELRIPLNDRALGPWLAGPNEAHLRMIESELGVSARMRGEGLWLTGDDAAVRLAEALIAQLSPLLHEGEALDFPRLRSAMEALKADPEAAVGAMFREVVVRTAKGKPVRPRTLTQQAYVQAILKHDLTFGSGPAGTGKTYLAAALAVRALKAGEVSRVILTRPVVEAGESLGYLPGGVHEKVDPYFRPLWDALSELMEPERLARHVEKGMIEVAPLAYMRGRTLAEAFVILDEAQNTSLAQMKLFLTRMGPGSKVVVTGDPEQVDLPKGTPSALAMMPHILGHLPEVAFVRFGASDVVRHDLVRKVLEAWALHDQASGGARG